MNHRHLYPVEEPFVVRTCPEYERDAALAEKTKQTVRGIKGRCFLTGLIKIPDDVPIDAMHQVFLGAGKLLICSLVRQLSKKNELLLGDRLKAMKCPRLSYGDTKPISEISYWKARDFKFFLFHYGMSGFDGLISSEFGRSFNVFSTAMRLLSMKTVSAQHISDAEQLIAEFYHSFLRLYGVESQSYNFHSIKHLCDQVRKKGPLWNSSTFSFESANHFLLSSVRGSSKNLSHIVDNFLLRQQNGPTNVEAKIDANDALYTSVAQECRLFADLFCGPGQFRSRQWFPDQCEKLSSLSYTRLGENWFVHKTLLITFNIGIFYHPFKKLDSAGRIKQSKCSHFISTF